MSQHPFPIEALPCAPGEIWKALPGYTGSYAVSTHGRVARLAPSTRTVPGQIFTGSLNRIHGYRMMQLTSPRVLAPIYRLVWRTFRGPVPDGMRITHRDGNSTNDRLENLALTTYAEQAARLHAAGKMPRLRGAANGNAKLSDEDLLSIRANEGKLTAAETAGKYGITRWTVYAIRRGRYRRLLSTAEPCRRVMWPPAPSPDRRAQNAV